MACRNCRYYNSEHQDCESVMRDDCDTRIYYTPSKTRQRVEMFLGAVLLAAVIIAVIYLPEGALL